MALAQRHCWTRTRAPTRSASTSRAARPDAERRRSAIAAIREEAALIELALTAEHAETRMAAAERVRTPEGLRRLADAARNKDHGVARLAKQRIDAMADRENQAAEADAVLAQLEALANEPGPILTAVIELNRRWQALDLGDDAARLARCEAARQALQARFDREHEEQRARARFERRLGEWLGRADPPATPDALAGALHELSALRDEAQQVPGGLDRVAGSRRRNSASSNGRWSSRRWPERRRSSSKPSSSPPARPSTTRNCRNGGRRWIEARARPR